MKKIRTTEWGANPEKNWSKRASEWFSSPAQHPNMASASTPENLNVEPFRSNWVPWRVTNPAVEAAASWVAGNDEATVAGLGAPAPAVKPASNAPTTATAGRARRTRRAVTRWNRPVISG